MSRSIPPKIEPFGSVQIRPARTEDAGGLAELWLELGRHLTGLNDQAFKMPEADGLAEWFAQILSASGPDEATFVAEVDQHIVGTVYVRIVQPMTDASRQVLREAGLVKAEIDALAVAEAFRRRGMGRLLMSVAEQWGADKGATLFQLYTYIASPLSVPFYERLGYARRSIRFVKPSRYGSVR